jgi:hypothetical protein
VTLLKPIQTPIFSAEYEETKYVTELYEHTSSVFTLLMSNNTIRRSHFSRHMSRICHKMGKENEPTIVGESFTFIAIYLIRVIRLLPSYQDY